MGSAVHSAAQGLLSMLPSSHSLYTTVLCLVIFCNIGVSQARRQYRGDGQHRDVPKFIETDTNITVHPGERAVLRCRIDNLGTKSVTWRKDGEMTPLTIGYFTFSPDTRISLDFNQRIREWSLIIQSVRTDDEGWYLCLINTKENDDMDMIYKIRLNVLTVQVTGTEYVELGTSVELMCNATGKPDPPHDVHWFKDGNMITSDAEKGIVITKKIETKVLVSMLVIQESTMNDEAFYICRSSNNDAGEIHVNILNVPITPNVKRGASSSGASRAWSRAGPPLGAGAGYFGTALGLTLVSWLGTRLLWFRDIRWLPVS